MCMLMRQLLLMTACRRSAERDGSLKKKRGTTVSEAAAWKNKSSVAAVGQQSPHRLSESHVL